MCARDPDQTICVYVVFLPWSSGAWRGAPNGVATLKVRKSAFDALNKGSGALKKWSKVVAHSRAPPWIRKILVSVKFVSAILGPEMAAPILWTPGKNAFFLQENLHVHKIPRFGGGDIWFGGGGSADFIFMGAGIFLTEELYDLARALPPCARAVLWFLPKISPRRSAPAKGFGASTCSTCTRTCKTWEEKSPSKEHTHTHSYTICMETNIYRGPKTWKATTEYLNQRGTKIRVFRVLFLAPFLPPFSPSFFPPFFPFRPCALSHHFSPSSPPLFPPLFFDSWKNSDLGTPLI